MLKSFKYLFDFAVLALLYFLWLCPKWPESGDYPVRDQPLRTSSDIRYRLDGRNTFDFRTP